MDAIVEQVGRKNNCEVDCNPLPTLTDHQQVHFVAYSDGKR